MKVPISVILLVSILTSCSGSIQKNPQPDHYSLTSFELYLSRPSFTEVDFEQYKLSGGYLVKECGLVRRGRHHAIEQDIDSLDSKQLEMLAGKSWPLIDYLDQGGKAFGKAGKNKHFADPGRASLKIVSSGGTEEILTSVDNISSPKSIGERRLLHFVEVVRGIGKGSHCGKIQFYDIEAKKP